MGQVVASWLKTFKPLESGGVRAFLNVDWELLRAWPMPESWSEDEARLVLTLFRPAPESVQEFVSQYCLDTQDEQGAPTVWGEYLSSPFTEPRLVSPEALFEIQTGVNGGCSSWFVKIQAIALTDELALLVEANDEVTLDTFPDIVGVITRKDAARSAALLFLERGECEARFTENTSLYSELSAKGIPTEEVYRIALARCGHGGRRLISIPADRLRTFRTPEMARGFRAFRELLEPTPRVIRKQTSRAAVPHPPADARVEVFFGETPEEEDTVPVYCVDCGSGLAGMKPGVIFDGRPFECAGCGRALVKTKVE
jgi:hypothetical protein